VVFYNWMVVFHEDTIVYMPSDEEDFRRLAASAIRHAMNRNQQTMNVSPLHKGRATDTEQTLEELAASIRLPKPDEIWDCSLNKDLLRKACHRTQEEMLIEHMIYKGHYRPLLAKVRLAENKDYLSWASWLKQFCALKVLANSLATALQEKVEHDWKNAVIKVRSSELAKLIAEATSLSHQECFDGIRLMTLNPKRRKREIWDQPLLPIAPNLLGIAPQLIGAIDLLYALDNIIIEYGGAEFAVRGPEFEDEVYRIVDSLDQAIVEKNLSFRDRENQPIEYDVLVWWQGFMLVLEAKCLKVTHSPVDDSRTWAALEHSTHQLARRKQFLLEEWEKVSEALLNFNLPAKPVGPERIICIAVCNLFRFSGLEHDGVIITDSLCLDKYINNPEIVLVTSSADGELYWHQVDTVRQSEPTPQGLIAYLQNPVQVSWYFNATSATYTFLPKLNDKDRGLVYAMTEFNRNT
jgi:hypothetical protein